MLAYWRIIRNIKYRVKWEVGPWIEFVKEQRFECAMAGISFLTVPVSSVHRFLVTAFILGTSLRYFKRSPIQSGIVINQTLIDRNTVFDNFCCCCFSFQSIISCLAKRTNLGTWDLVMIETSFWDQGEYYYVSLEHLRYDFFLISYSTDLRSGKYWVLKNYFRPRLLFHCNESVTLTSQGEYQFLDNLGPLLRRLNSKQNFSFFN